MEKTELQKWNEYSGETVEVFKKKKNEAVKKKHEKDSKALFVCF